MAPEPKPDPYASLRSDCYAHWAWEASHHRPHTPAFVPIPSNRGTAASKAHSQGRSLELQTLARQVSECQRCRLSTSRTNTVFARGNPNAEVAFVGEGPGYHEDQQALPFVGAAGQLLNRMIQAMRYAPDDVYICNVVKCRPPENRNPMPDEIAACSEFLQKQLGLVAPRVIVALGKCAAAALRSDEQLIHGWRGSWTQWQGIDVLSTYHPAFLLRSPEHKKIVWEDLKQVMQKLGKL